MNTPIVKRPKHHNRSNQKVKLSHKQGAPVKEDDFYVNGLIQGFLSLGA